MRLPTTRCDQSGLNPMPGACDGRSGVLLYASRSNAIFACQRQLWRPAAKSQPRRPRQISKNIRSYWIWKATSKIVAYATKCAVPSAGITPRRTVASQIVVYATKCDIRGWLRCPSFPRPIHFDAIALPVWASTYRAHPRFRYNHRPSSLDSLAYRSNYCDQRIQNRRVDPGGGFHAAW
jgi:hypothetical protein